MLICHYVALLGGGGVTFVIMLPYSGRGSFFLTLLHTSCRLFMDYNITVLHYHLSDIIRNIIKSEPITYEALSSNTIKVIKYCNKGLTVIQF